MSGPLVFREPKITSLPRMAWIQWLITQNWTIQLNWRKFKRAILTLVLPVVWSKHGIGSTQKFKFWNAQSRFLLYLLELSIKASVINIFCDKVDVKVSFWWIQPVKQFDNSCLLTRVVSPIFTFQYWYTFIYFCHPNLCFQLICFFIFSLPYFAFFWMTMFSSFSFCLRDRKSYSIIFPLSVCHLHYLPIHLVVILVLSFYRVKNSKIIQVHFSSIKYYEELKALLLWSLCNHILFIILVFSISILEKRVTMLYMEKAMAPHSSTLA